MCIPLINVGFVWSESQKLLPLIRFHDWWGDSSDLGEGDGSVLSWCPHTMGKDVSFLGMVSFASPMTLVL